VKTCGVVLICGILFSAPPSEARCGDSPLILTKEYLHESEIIAFGQVTEIHRDTTSPHNSFAVLKLEGSWKGDPPNPFRIYPPDSVHGFRFESGHSYLVFADRSDDQFIASFCGPTCLESECLQHLELLGEPTQRH
jgi:hypothetical protein